MHPQMRYGSGKVNNCTFGTYCCRLASFSAMRIRRIFTTAGLLTYPRCAFPPCGSGSDYTVDDRRRFVVVCFCALTTVYALPRRDLQQRELLQNCTAFPFNSLRSGPHWKPLRLQRYAIEINLQIFSKYFLYLRYEQTISYYADSSAGGRVQQRMRRHAAA